MLVAFDAAGANLNTSSSCSLRERNPLEIRVLACVARRVELGCADTV